MAKLNSKLQLNKVLILLFVMLIASVIIQQLFNKGNVSEEKAKVPSNQEEAKLNLDLGSNGEIKVTVDFGDGRKMDRGVTATTPYGALQELSSSQGFKVIAKEYKYGLMVDEVNKVKNSSEKYWAYWVNGKAGQIASDRYNLSPGDIVEWKYTSAK